MDLSCTPRGRFSRRKFISPSAATPYRSPLMQNLPEKNKRKTSIENVSNELDELKSPKIAFSDNNDTIKEKIHQVQQKFVCPVATSSPFRSPLACNIPMERKEQIPSKNVSFDELKASTIELWEKNKILNDKIYHLEQKGLKEEDLKCHIDQLHKYNEIKDIAQTVMGRLAILEQKTIKEVYEDFGMEEND